MILYLLSGCPSLSFDLMNLHCCYLLVELLQNFDKTPWSTGSTFSIALKNTGIRTHFHIYYLQRLKKPKKLGMIGIKVKES